MAVNISDQRVGEDSLTRRILWQVPYAGSAVLVALQFDGEAGIKLATFDPTDPDNTPMPAIMLAYDDMIEVGTSLAWLGVTMKRQAEAASDVPVQELQETEAEVDSDAETQPCACDGPCAAGDFTEVV